MHPAVPYSRPAHLAQAINASETQIVVIDTGDLDLRLPAGGGQAVIGDSEVAETITYASRNGNVLVGVVRAVEHSDMPRDWATETPVVVRFTADMYETLVKNIGVLDEKTSAVQPIALGGTGAITAAEARQNLGAAAAIGTRLTNTDLNNITTPGQYWVFDSDISGVINNPFNSAYYLWVLQWGVPGHNTEPRRMQVAKNIGTGEEAYREFREDAGSWRGWIRTYSENSPSPRFNSRLIAPLIRLDGRLTPNVSMTNMPPANIIESAVEIATQPNAAAPAMISFHRSGFSVNTIGLDTDNVFKIKIGSTVGVAPHPIWHSGNLPQTSGTFALTPVSGVTQVTNRSVVPHWRRTGNLVTVQFDISIVPNGQAGQRVTIGGLPFISIARNTGIMIRGGAAVGGVLIANTIDFSMVDMQTGLHTNVNGNITSDTLFVIIGSISYMI